MPSEPVRITVADADLQRSRVTVLFRLILAIPHLIVLGIFAAIAIVLAPFHWLATLFSGNPPDALADYFRMLVRYSLQVYAYLYLTTARFPPWPGTNDEYAIDVSFPPAARQNRWSVGFRLLLALPALLLASALTGGFGFGFNGSATESALQGSGAAAAAAFLAWFACLVTGRMPQGLRDLQIYALGYATQAYSYLFLLTDQYPNAAPRAYPSAPMPDHPVTLSLSADDLRRSRLTTFFRLPLAVPHLIWLALWSIVALLVAIAAWLAALVRGQVPAALHRFLAAYVRYTTHFTAFLYLTANAFPGFTGTAGSYPAEATIAAPERQSRWTVLTRGILLLPAFVILSALGGIYGLTAIFAWWIALFTGRIPRGVRDAGAFALRYSTQTYAYALLLTPRYPYAGPGPGTSARNAPAAPEPAPPSYIPDQPVWTREAE
ncbi:MAG TPA: DUF4389 domain-containing protein [Solirubrobacteraceae bacterium]|nr:DUF4389 domain-containing protein [Solirubrobacteraceae bacterium]